MANPAAVIRQQVQQMWPGAIVVERGQDFIIHQHPTDPTRRTLDTSIGSLHYQSGGNWAECNTAWQPDTGAWQYKMVSAAFQLHARNQLNAGDIIQWLDPISGENVTLQPLALNWVNNTNDSRQQITQPQSVMATINDNTLLWTNGYGTGRHFRYTASTDQLIKHLIIDAASNLPAPTVANPYLELEFIIKTSAGVTLFVDGAAWDRTTKTATAHYIEFRLSSGAVVWRFVAPGATDAAGHSVTGIFQLRKQSNTRYCTVRIPKTWLDTAIFPVILDPTIESSVGASADDASQDSGGSAMLNVTSASFGTGDAAAHPHRASGLRFTSITVPNGATIDLAYISLSANNTWLGGYWTWYGQAADNAAAFSTGEDITARAYTTNSLLVNADGPGATDGTYYRLPATGSLAAIVAEITNRAGWSSGNAVVFVADGNKSSSWSSATYYTYDGGYGAQLHIEYTGGGGGITSIAKQFMHYARMRNN
jgi:hypothetical protein